MAKILGEALDLRRYQSLENKFDIESLMSDLGFFIREQGPEVIRNLLPQIPAEILTRLQYAPDHFSYHLIGGRLIASEDLKNKKFVDARSRVDKTEPERGLGAFLVLEKLAEILADEENNPDGEMVLWASPKEGFSRHAYLNIGTIGRDEGHDRRLSVSSYMSDFSFTEIKNLISHLTGLEIPAGINPRLLSRMVFLARHKDLIGACHAVLNSGRTIEGVAVEKLYGAGSAEIWKAIRSVVRDGEKKVAEVVRLAQGEVEKMQTGMAQTVFGFIESVLDSIGKERGVGFVKERSKFIQADNLLAAFMNVAVGCIGGLMSPAGFGGVALAPVPVLGMESNRVHCPNCNRTVSCPIGQRCPGCDKIRPC